MLLTIDIGNTRLKTAVFEKDTLIDFQVFNKLEAEKKIEKILKKFPQIQNTIASSVSNWDISTRKLLQSQTNFIEVNSDFKIPFNNKYKTPETLGIDRLVLAAGVSLLFSNRNTLVIDCGTCITYDFLDEANNYYGGAISPGLEMRYKALHTFTAKLPLLKKKNSTVITGNSSENAIHSGVLNGISFEIDGFISQYSLKNKDLTVILTGGDAEFLAKRLKSTIFVRSNFLLESLNVFFNYLKHDND